MQIVIDIDENVFTRLFDNVTEDYAIVNDDLFKIAKSIRKGTVLPDNPTNGDMIKTVFPNASITEIGGGSTIVVANDYKFNSTWWNAPYREEKE